MREPRIAPLTTSVVRTPPSGVPAVGAEAPPLAAPMTWAERALWERERVKVHGRHVAILTATAWGFDLGARVVAAVLGIGPSLDASDAIVRAAVSLVVGGGIVAATLPGLTEGRVRDRWLKAHRLRQALLE